MSITTVLSVGKALAVIIGLDQLFIFVVSHRFWSDLGPYEPQMVSANPINTSNRVYYQYGTLRVRITTVLSVGKSVEVIIGHQNLNIPCLGATFRIWSGW